MKNDTNRAKNMLKVHDFTCVLCKGDTCYTSHERGVKPLLEFIESNTDLAGFSAADKVVGNAAAFLYVKLGADEVYADVMSRAAVSTLQKYGISAIYDIIADTIRNRTNTGICPMEGAVQDATSPDDAYLKILARLETLKNNDLHAPEPPQLV